MKVTVDLDDADVFRLTEKARQLGMTVGDVLRHELTTIRLNSTPPDIDGLVRELVTQEGWCDADIATHINQTVSAVSTIRRRMRLPANRRYPKKEKP